MQLTLYAYDLEQIFSNCKALKMTPLLWRKNVAPRIMKWLDKWRREMQMEAGIRVLSVCCNDLKMAVFFVNQENDQYLRFYNVVDLS